MVKKLKYIGQGMDIFLLGDLNLTPDEDSYSKLTENYSDVLPVEKRYDTFPAKEPIKRIDYILFNKNYSNFDVKVENIFKHKIDWSRISDHYPIMITISPVVPTKTVFQRGYDKLPSCCIF